MRELRRGWIIMMELAPPKLVDARTMHLAPEGGVERKVCAIHPLPCRLVRRVDGVPSHDLIGRRHGLDDHMTCPHDPLTRLSNDLFEGGGCLRVFQNDCDLRFPALPALRGRTRERGNQGSCALLGL